MVAGSVYWDCVARRADVVGLVFGVVLALFGNLFVAFGGECLGHVIVSSNGSGGVKSEGNCTDNVNFFNPAA
jgi:hypothetical protein